MTFVDTSAFYALLDRDDAHHAEARASWIKALESAERLLTSNYVVVETTALLQHRLGIAAVRAFTQDVLAVAEVEWMTPEDHAAASAAHLLAGRRDLSLVDCASFQIMRRIGMRRAFAFDEDFRQQGFEMA